MHLIILPALMTLRLIAALMFAAAAAAGVAAAVALSLGPSPRVESLQGVSVYAMTLAAAVGAAALGYYLLMPSTAKLTRQLPHDADGSLPTPLVILLVALTGAAVLQLPSAAAWLTGNLALLGQLMGGESDPMGFHYVPGAMLAATPVMAALAVLSFTFAGMLALAVPLERMAAVMTASTLQQAGLVGGLYATDHALRALGGAVQKLVDSASDPTASAQVADWLARYDLARGSLGTRLLWLLAGYGLALVLSVALVRRRESSVDEPVSMPVDDEHGVAPEPGPESTHPVVSPTPMASPDFQDSLYSVRPRNPWLGIFLWRYPAYEIASIPPRSRERFSLSWSWTTGVIRRDADGMDLVSIAISRSGGLIGRRAYALTDARTGAAIGTLSPVGSDWEVRDASGQPLAHVLEIEAGAGRARFVASAGAREICRFVWGFAGHTAASAEVQVEFMPGAEARIHKALAIVLGAVLEHRARGVSRRSN